MDAAAQWHCIRALLICFRCLSRLNIDVVTRRRGRQHVQRALGHQQLTMWTSLNSRLPCHMCIYGYTEHVTASGSSCIEALTQ